MPENRNTGGGIREALDMLDLFAGIGVRFFDITHTNIDEEKRGFRPKQTLEQAKESMPYLVPSSARRQNNVIIRPHQPPAVLLIQLDDLSADNLVRVKPSAFMIVGTSPGNHQAWIAVSGEIADSKDFARRVRKAAGADPSASGATRIAGTANYKRKYEPQFPVIKVTAAQPGLTVTPDELEAAGLVAAPEASKPATFRISTGGGPRRWPSYKYCVDRAPKAHNQDKPDISRADFAWCMTAIDWGYGVEETAARLMEESGKAQENGQGYAMETAANAAAAVERRRHRQPEPQL